MSNSWIKNIEKGSISLEVTIKHISSLNEADSEILDRLMARINNECPQLLIKSIKGWGPPVSFHIKIPGVIRHSVLATVIPRKKNGIRVMSQLSLPGFVRSNNPQLKWQAQIQKPKDIDIVLKYLKSEVCS